MSLAIKTENLSKVYRLGEIGTGSLTRDLQRWWANSRGKEDPFLKIGQTQYRNQANGSDLVYSLKDINIEIKEGEAVGIIGKNGAGKSTLLKILSRVTSPTTGKIFVKGRIASLLEIGTGFHPDLTGRENIFLNGAILGMRKSEITRRLDEIIDFSGIAQYIDTPVKRYSSGMYVRLAFAVAAHLESEILVVDEVLAVGDAEFQKKCLGKMGEVSSGKGRTVLFVSHNMFAIKTLCTSSIFLQDGMVASSGPSKSIIEIYLNNKSAKRNSYYSDIKDSIIKNIQVLNDTLYFDQEIKIKFEIDAFKIEPNSDALEIFFSTIDDIILFNSVLVLNSTSNTFTCTIPANTFNTGVYKLTAGISHHFMTWKEKTEDALSIEIEEEAREISYMGRWEGLVRPKIEWK
jgi:lipopolysaccharide transport system ATP-binding protein